MLALLVYISLVFSSCTDWVALVVFFFFSSVIGGTMSIILADLSYIFDCDLFSPTLEASFELVWDPL